MTEKFLATDKSVRLHTGLPNRATFDSLLELVTPTASTMKYWTGASRVAKRKRGFEKSIKKSGPKRQLTMQSELLLVLMKLRLALNYETLSIIFQITSSSCSTIINTWVKALAQLLKNLVFWPDKATVAKMTPPHLRSKFRNLRCTIDCSETFIQRPRDLKLQMTTWSDYKHHNTLKYLVGIAPDGLISFISKAWGGRITDRQIVQLSGFLDLIDPGDLILADRGFPIQEDLLFRHATLQIPPSSSGIEQQCTAQVNKTKRIANVRIHVERGINRLKWFAIIDETLPLTMVPLFDDILLVCAALCNLHKPLVK